MFDDLFLTSSMTSDFSFGLTTELAFTIEPDVTTDTGEIVVEFPPFVFEANETPTPTDDYSETDAATAVDIDVLANDEDPDGDQMVIP